MEDIQVNSDFGEIYPNQIDTRLLASLGKQNRNTHLNSQLITFEHF